MTVATVEDVLRVDVADEELEYAAEEVAMSYTYQTSSSYGCCN
jgi:hypothetical protein